MIYRLEYYNSLGEPIEPEVDNLYSNMEAILGHLEKQRFFRIQELASGYELVKLRHQAAKNCNTALIHIYTDHPERPGAKYLHTFEFIQIRK